MERHAREQLERLTAAIEELTPDWSLRPAVEALQALRGVALIGTVTFMTEVGHVHRFDHPRKLMAYLGLVPSEASSGFVVRRGCITKAGNARVRRTLIVGAWTIAELCASASSRDTKTVRSHLKSKASLGEPKRG